MLSISFQPEEDSKPRLQSVYNDYFKKTISWVSWEGLTIHLSHLDQIETLRDLLDQFIQESYNANSPLSNGDRLDNSGDVPLVPAESF